MLQGEAPAQGGVAGNVGEDQPGGSRAEAPEALRTVLLELVVGLEIIVEAKHERIIQRALGPARSEQAQHLAAPAPTLARRQSCLRAETLEQSAEGFGSSPDTRLLQVDINKQAQDALAIGGPARKGIHVQEVI